MGKSDTTPLLAADNFSFAGFLLFVLSFLVQFSHILRFNDQTFIIQVTSAMSSGLNICGQSSRSLLTP